MNEATPVLPTAEQVAALTREGRETGKQALTRAFPNHREAIEAAFAVSGGAPSVSSQPKQQAYIFHDPSASLNRAQKVSGYKALLPHASDQTAVFRSAAADGIAPDELTTGPIASSPMSLDEANAQLAANDDPALVAGSSPNDYKISFDRETIEGLDPSDVAALNSEYTEALHVAEIPLRLAQPLVTATIESGNKFEDMSDGELRLAFAHEGQRVRRAVSNIEQTVADHNLAFSRLPDHFKELASAHYLFHSAEAFVALANAGAAIREREARRAKK